MAPAMGEGSSQYVTHTPGSPTEVILLNFGMMGDITDVITHAKF